MRTFLAARVAPTPALRRLHERLSRLGERIRPARISELHVTLKFLGETAQIQLREICTVAQRIAGQHSRVPAKLARLGAFPHKERPSVVWVGLQEAQVLSRIAGELDRELSELGFPAEGRAFQPHVTILRIKSRPPETLLSMLSEDAGSEFGISLIDKIELIQSELTRAGSRYTTLAVFALGESN